MQEVITVVTKYNLEYETQEGRDTLLRDIQRSHENHSLCGAGLKTGCFSYLPVKGSMTWLTPIVPIK